jgi:hypothetical protein
MGIMSRQNFAAPLVAMLLALTAIFPTALAQQPSLNTQAATLPSDDALDALLTARNWNDLGAALSRPGTNEEFARRLNWLKTRIDSGGGFLLGILYARDLWAIGSRLKIDDPAKDPRVTAALISLYAYELILIDGARCEDRSAPGNRATQLLTQRAATLAFLKQQLPDLKSKIVEIAIALERKTAPLRKDDDLMCRDGLEEMKAGLERGTQQEMPNAPGYVGKRIAVTPPTDWTPEFASPEVYRPMQDKARTDMRENLRKFIGLSP